MEYTDMERRILDMWPKFEDGAYVMYEDEFDFDGEVKTAYGFNFGVGGRVSICSDKGSHVRLPNGERVKRPKSAPIGSDGLPINEGDEVWDHITGEGPFTVFEIDVDEDRDSAEHLVLCSDVGPHGFNVWRIAGQMTHTKPELNDLWDRLYEDARQLDIDLGDTTDDYPRMSCCRNLVKRAKALAEKEAAR